MAPRPIVAATLQAAMLGAISNVLAQFITASRTKTEFSIDWIPVLQFLLFSTVNTPPNFLWFVIAHRHPRLPSSAQSSRDSPSRRQEFLESTFPARPQPLSSSGNGRAKGKQQGRKGQSDRKPEQVVREEIPLSVRNTVIKFALDQTIGAAVNTLLFSTFMRALHEAMHPVPRMTNLLKAVNYWTAPSAIDFSRVDGSAVWEAAQAEFWSIAFAGLRFWPFVSLLNFTVVKTVAGRNLVGSLAGVVWGVYMSMVAAAQ
ncbi:uncharacterized protein DCS_02173 [Drechmeria coniospora]|uniref:Mpv17/PMP22 family protein n=1 Tax=Drechmeria coniospora TaxID=98403 RepID=A0A151GVD6_DRECN|nr:uncharacterized protein DCS_02173 [Drechmeria coniospora]KYK61033.1 uncharacterized protein DCS_02173 [Drechmeria coniospora]